MPAALPESDRRRAAFSLVELALTMVIVGLIAAIAVPRYADAQARYRVDAAAQRVIADLAFAQSRAKTRSKAITATFDPAAETMIITGVAGNDNRDADYLTDFADTPYTADLVSADFAGNPTLTYTGYGTPISGGTIVLAAGNNTRTITVDPSTGEAALP